MTYISWCLVYLFMPSWLIRIHWQPTPSIHVHHYFYGIVIMAVIGFIRLVYPNLKSNLIAIVYGFGLLLVVDELTMLFRFKEENMGFADYYGSIIIVCAFAFIHFVDRIKKSW